MIGVPGGLLGGDGDRDVCSQGQGSRAVFLSLGVIHSRSRSRRGRSGQVSSVDDFEVFLIQHQLQNDDDWDFAREEVELELQLQLQHALCSTRIGRYRRRSSPEYDDIL